MNRILFIVLLALVIIGCTSTQRLHFSNFSFVDFQLNRDGITLDLPENICIGEITAGDYTQSGEFTDYSWHALIDGTYEGFNSLPYRNVESQVKSWLYDLFESSNLISKNRLGNTLDVFIRRMKLKTQKRIIGKDYRACLVELQITIHDNLGNLIQKSTIEGIAKLPGADTIVVDNNLLHLSIKFSPDEPAVCKLAIANALRGEDN